MGARTWQFLVSCCQRGGSGRKSSALELKHCTSKRTNFVRVGKYRCGQSAETAATQLELHYTDKNIFGPDQGLLGQEIRPF
jgi:hypothetical protein